MEKLWDILKKKNHMDGTDFSLPILLATGLTDVFLIYCYALTMYV